MQIATRVKDALELLSLWGEFEQGLKALSRLDEVHALVARIKESAKSKRREFARTHHPDRGGDIEKMQAFNAACDTVQMLTFQVRQPQVRVVQVVMTGNWGWSPTISTTGGVWWP